MIRFYKRTERQPRDQIFQLYQANGFASLRRLQPVLLPVYTERGLKNNNTFIQFFSAALGQVDKKMDILKKAFFCDDLLSRELPRFRADEYKYFLFFFPGLEKVVTHFYHYAWPEEFGNVDVRRVQKYGWVVERYYQYYDSLIGKLIGSMGDDELLVVLGFAEPEPLDLWQRILINYLGRKDVFVWTTAGGRRGPFSFTKSRP